ncbi:hypothetical protein H0E87_000874 [Populus deltoides]|uniref:Uncharacterized protein n=1 Tax=Populus deltoides TaxID=3696 RepID=A0A8T2ZP77_POPDE|nr:hypothetical protein H0E87_000874 [Populus deltoides]
MIFIFYWLPFFHSIYSWESESQTHKRKKLNAERESRRMAMVSWNLGAHQKTPALHVTCRKKERDRDHSYPYKVIEITPPPKNLGIRCFPTNLQCGESVTIEGQAYTISAVTHRYQLRKGKYEPSEKRLDVLSTGRYILNLYLENLLEQS